jgi:hypothetical protein
VSRELFALLLLLAPIGCGSDAEPVDTNEPPAKPQTPTDPPPTVVPSFAPHVRFKGGAVYASDLARGLDLDREEVCLELGVSDCATVVHKVALGGVDPYDGGVYQPLPRAPVTAPIALDRIAVSACSLRAERDFANPATAAIFGALAQNDTSAEARGAVVMALYDELLLRTPTTAEHEAVVGLYDELDGDAVPRRWAKLACIAIATTTEAAFY